MAETVYNIDYIDSITGALVSTARYNAAKASGDLTGLKLVSSDDLAPLHTDKRSVDLSPGVDPPPYAIWAWEDNTGIPRAVNAQQVLVPRFGSAIGSASTVNSGMLLLGVLVLGGYLWLKKR